MRGGFGLLDGRLSSSRPPLRESTCPGTAATVGDVCGFSCAAMLVVMAARFDLYAGKHH
jgi:hypothetical protein